MEPLTKFEADVENVTLIKIDAENCEAAILRGALPVIERFKPAIFVEAQTRSALFDLSRILRPFGYSPGAQFNVTPTYEFTQD